MKRASSPAPWSSDLCHPAPLAAVAALAVNDHLLKGSGLLPGWLTGKISDFAGLFFFPVLLSATARGVVRLAMGRDIEDRRALAAAAAIATGVVFTLLKLSAPFNAWLTDIWGVNVMDPTDLIALPMLPLAVAFMLRRPRAPRSPRRLLDLAALVGAGLASMATSQAAPPPPPPPQPPAQPVAIAAPDAAPDGCAALTAAVCERSASMTFVTVRVAATGPDACAIEVLHAGETTRTGARQDADMLPAPVTVKGGGQATFSLSFLRPIDPEEQAGQLVLDLEVRRGGQASTVSLRRECTRR